MPEASLLSWDVIRQYLDSIAVTSNIDIERTRDLFSQAQTLCPEKLRTIFISNYVEADGKQQFKDLWMFSDSYVIEVLNFAKEEIPKLDMTIFSKNIQGVEVQAQNFNLSHHAISNSKLHIVFYMLNDYSCDQQAFGQNCNSLFSLFKKYIRPNLARGGSLREEE